MNWKQRKKRQHRRQARSQSPGSGTAAADPSKGLVLINGLAGEPDVQRSKSKVDPRRALRLRIAELPTLAEQRVRAAAAAARITAEERAQLARRIASGTSETLRAVNGGLPLDAVLGVDFGTSSTKIVARLPYQPGSPSVAVPALSFSSAERHPHMWESRLWMTSDGTFSLAPKRDAGVLCSIKANLMAPHCERRTVMHTPGISATALECAVAFLTLQIRQARGWLHERHSASFRRGTLRWHYNMGLPAAKLDDSSGVRHYRTCLAASVEIANRPGCVSLDVVRRTISSIDGSEKRLEMLRATLQPEIAAAVAGFARSRRREDGLYAMIDVGAGTMDCCTFSLVAGSESDRCPIFAADVSLLGVQPWEICDGRKELETSFKKEVNERICEVLRPTRRKKYPNSPRWQDGLPVFLVGGGRPSPVHRSEITKIDSNMKGSHLGGLSVRELPAPEGLDHMAGTDQLHRLAVAVGLSLPANDIPEVELPTSIDDIAPMAKRDYESNYIGPEMV